MRTRLVRPAFWTDARMADLPDSTRLTYIGLWCLADDAGYFDLDGREIAAELYRYRSARVRERQVAKHLDELFTAQRIRRLDCGRHAIIPSLPEHRIKGGQQLFGTQKEHETHCPTSLSVGLRRATSDSVSVSVSDSSSVSVSLTGSEPTEDGSIDPEKEWRELGHKWGRKPRPAAHAN